MIKTRKAVSLQIMEDNIKNQERNTLLMKWCEQMLSYRIPRWNELPEIELYMDQVIALMEKYLGVFYDEENKTITPSIINNYVKLGLVPPPIKKRYSKIHLAYLLIICILKQVMPINVVMKIIECQTQKYPIEDVYDHFCEEQERSLLGAIKKASNFCSPSNNEIFVEDFILSSAITANSEKAVAEKFTNIMDSMDSSEKKEKEKEKDKEKEKSRPKAEKAE